MFLMYQWDTFFWDSADSDFLIPQSISFNVPSFLIFLEQKLIISQP